MHKFKVRPFRKLFYNNKDSYGAFGCNLVENLTDKNIELGKYNSITIKGSMPELSCDQDYIVSCKQVIDHKYGIQYEVVITSPSYLDYTDNIDYTKNNIESISTDIQKSFLKEIVTELQLQSIFDVYEKPIDEIINGTFDYRKVYNIGKFRYNILKDKVIENFCIYKIIVEFSKYGLNFRQASCLMEEYSNPDLVIQRIYENPYDVLMRVPHMNFKKIDKFALNIGVEHNDKRRICACFEYFLDKESYLGHVWIDINVIYENVFNYIEDNTIDKNNIIEYINNSNRLILIDGYKLAKIQDYKDEIEIKDELFRIRDAENRAESNFNIDIDDFILKQEQKQGFRYDEVQKEAFMKVIKNNVFILTGFGGTGKTFTTNGILNMLDDFNMSYILMSPSAKAAKVLKSSVNKEENSNRETSTIHRGLGWTPVGFIFNEENKLPYDVVLIDEISMVGLDLFKDLLNAIEDGTKLIIVGDVAQLASLSKGSILDDMLQSEKFANTKLTKIFRQEENSGIINVATKTRNGEYFVNNNDSKIKKFGKNNDTLFIPTNKNTTLDCINKIYKQLLNKGYNDEDITVIMPANVGECGTKVINRVLQELNNPKVGSASGIKHTIDDYFRYFRENDKVIHIKNDYKKQWYDENYEIIVDKKAIFNGDIGRVIKIDYDSRIVWVKYEDDNKIIRYEYDDLYNLLHAWSLSVHKFQGSQSKVVIFGLDSRNAFQAKRNLIYTAITRASDLLIIVGEPWVINKGIDCDEVLSKRTFLKELLTGDKLDDKIISENEGEE